MLLQFDLNFGLVLSLLEFMTALMTEDDLKEDKWLDILYRRVSRTPLYNNSVDIGGH